ncbi:MAG TPA: hypothetical protein VGE46_07205, partial [Bdellovibrio sp.]
MTTVGEAMTQVFDSKTAKFLYQEKNFYAYRETLSPARQKSLNKLLKSEVLQSAASPESVERFALELSETLFGQRDTFNQRFLTKKEQRIAESDINIMKEQILRKGLVEVWKNEADPTRVSRTKKLTDRIWTLLFSKKGELFTLGSSIFHITYQAKAPIFLPRYFDKQVSEETLFFVIRDGYLAHKDRVRHQLKIQDHIEAYNTFRRLYQPIIMGLLFVILAEDAWEKYTESLNQDVDKIVKDLKSQREFL